MHRVLIFLYERETKTKEGNGVNVVKDEASHITESVPRTIQAESHDDGCEGASQAN